MKVKVNKKIGDATYQFVIDEDKDLDAVEQGAVFGSAPTQCGLCGSTNVHLGANRAKDDSGNEYKFVKVICDECNGRSQLGQYKTGGFFWKDWKEYTPPSEEEPQKGQSIH